MRFDWYQTTIEDDPRVVVETLAKLGHELRPSALAKRYRYEQGWEVHHNARGIVAQVFAGGNGGKPHALATSDATDAFVAVVREEWPDRHLVTRLDAAEDFNESGAYNRLRRITRAVAKRHRLAFTQLKDELDPFAGRTQYVGSPSSDYRARLYEKGWEEVGKLIALFPKQMPSGVAQHVTSITNQVTGEEVRPEDWTRLELQVRPRQEEGRRLAAQVTPEQAWGFSPWSHELAKETMALDLERMAIRTRKVSKDEEALRWMCRQYAGQMTRLKADLGDWACVGKQLGEWIEEQQRLS